MMNDLIIIGASGFGREVLWLVDRINKVRRLWNVVGFIDDNEDIQKNNINGYSVIGKTDDVMDYQDAYFICAVGASIVRKRIVSKVSTINPRIKFASLIDPTAEMSNFVEVGEGSIICAHTLITVNVKIGEHVIVNLDCTIGHDAVIDSFTTLYPSVNVSGSTTIGHCCELGTGVQIIQGITVEDNSIIGAGAVVVNNIPGNHTIVGCPAKPIK